MINRTNQIMTLQDGKEYAILRHIVYQGRTFYLAVEMTEDKEDIKEDSLELLEEVMYNGQKSIKKLRDANLTKIILENIKFPE